MFRLTEDNPKEIEPNEPEEGPIPVPSVKAMTSADNWLHHTTSILKNGRTAIIESEPPENVEAEDWTKICEAKDPSEPRLKSITKDARVKGNAPAWTVRAYGDMTEYLPSNPSGNRQNFGCVVVRCNTWPGAFSFFTQQKQH